ncbi:hypothetical protein FQN54_007606 [Arachnomyces sp. PD_36]|nr:hypothetical protein FQN54_007606 [Arachnomyces sp. PD_36]
MLEDDKYRTSTQFRLWSFTPSSLQSVRANTNALAAERVRCAIRRAREARGEDGAEAGGAGGAGAGEIECLTAEEELELVRYYCEKTMELGDEYKPPLPTMVRATAIQYLRRFYLTNSPMTYHPKSIMPCALFLATKTDNYYLSLSSFAEHIPTSPTPEDIIAPEFLLTQGLRFTFDVRHPFRGLEGGVMELLAIAEGDAHPGPHRKQKFPSAVEAQRKLESLPPSPGAGGASSSATNRIHKSHHYAREILKSAAQMTDAYFLYTPSQIWFAALYLADKPLGEFYFDYKIGLPESEEDRSADDPLSPLRTPILKKIKECADLLSSYTPSASASPERMKSLKRIGKKLYHCQNPEKVDLVGLNRAQKQKREGVSASSGAAAAGAAGEVFDGAGSGAGGGGVGKGEAVEMPERAVKKRKVGDDGGEMFGGELRG